MNNQLQLFHENCIPVMRRLPPASVDLLLTDPPYNLAQFMKERDTHLHSLRENCIGTQSWDNFNDEEWALAMESFLFEANRIVKVGGAIIIFMAIIKVETIIRLAQQFPMYYKTTGFWHKTNPMPRNMNLHFINANEPWIYFVNRKRTGTFNNHAVPVHDFFECPKASAAERKFGKHPAQKPEKLMRFFIETLTHENEIVLDPFMGSGTTGVAALGLNRRFIRS